VVQQRSGNGNGNNKVILWMVTLIFGTGQVLIAFSLKEIYSLNAKVQDRFTSRDALGMQADWQKHMDLRLKDFPPEWLTTDVKKNTERIESLEKSP